MSLGFPEIVVILVVALVVFGPKKLPEVGRTVGKALYEFRKATRAFSASVDDMMTADEDDPVEDKKAVDKVEPHVESR